MIVTSEYIHSDPNLNEINNIVKSTLQEHDKKYGDYYCRKIEVKCNIKFLDKRKNKTKILSSRDVVEYTKRL